MANITSNKTEISILLVDDDPICLATLKKSLQQLKHHVVAMGNPIDALCVLRKQEKSFDLVLTDVHMPEMSGLELLNHVEKEFKLPVILMSSDRDKGIMLKGLEDGAAFYFVKPVSDHMLSRIWQFAISCTTDDDDDDDDDLIVNDQHDMMHVDNDDNNNNKNKNKNNSSNSNNNSSSDINNNFIRNLLALMIQGNTPFFNPNALKRPNLFAMRIKHNSSLTKKPKLVWTTSLHNLFLEAVNKLGLDNAMPKKILDLMNVPGLKREHVASHLQKYRLFLKRILEVTKSMEDGIEDDRPFRSSFVLNEITYLTKALQQYYREFLAQSQGEINEGNLHEKGQNFTQVNNTFGDFNPNNKANPRNTTAVPGDQIRINPNQNVMEPNQLPGFRGCQQEFPRFEQQQIYGNNGKFNNKNNNNNNKPSKSYNYVGLQLDSNGELISPIFNQNNGGENSHGNAIQGIRGFGEKISGSQEELIYHHNFAYDFNKNNYSFVNNYNKNNNYSFENNYNKNNYSFENNYYNNNNNNNAAPVFDDVYLGIDDENNVYIPNEYDQNEEISPQENLFGMSKDVPTTMYGSIGDELRELGIDFQNDQEIFGNGLGFGSFGVQGDAQGSVFQGPDEEITLNDDISFESYFAQEFIEQEFNQQKDGIDFNNPN